LSGCTIFSFSRRAQLHKEVSVCIFVAEVTFLPSRCIAAIKDTYVGSQTDGRGL
jgi:hypothetical protein